MSRGKEENRIFLAFGLIRLEEVQRYTTMNLCEVL